MQKTTKTVLKYTFLPGIWPRVKALFSSGFSHVALYIALVFRMARLLPYGHPYLLPANTGRFGIRHVITEAWGNLRFRWANIDQIIMFFSVIAGLLLIFAQLISLIFIAFIPMAQAQVGGEDPSSFWITLQDVFGNEETTYDIAFIMLDRVFGFEGFFNSCVSQGVECSYNPLAADAAPGATIPASEAALRPSIPTAFHLALHQLFNYFNYGIMGIAIIGFLYLLTTVVAETTQSGQPFGQRFNKFWAPIRMIVVLALLTPYSSMYSLNGAQLLTLNVAKWGSNLGTNGWRTFTSASSGAMTPLGDPAALMARPNAPELNTFTEFLFTANACFWAYLSMSRGQTEVTPYMVRTAPGNAGGGVMEGNNFLDYRAEIEKAEYNDLYQEKLAEYQAEGLPGLERMNKAKSDVNSKAFQKVIDFSKGAMQDNIIIRFGVQDESYTSELGTVRPLCGEITLDVQDIVSPGAYEIKKGYFTLIMDSWNDEDFIDYAYGINARVLQTPIKNPASNPIPDIKFVDRKVNEFNNKVYDHENPDDGIFNAGVQAQIDDGRWDKNYDVHGWGGAAMWYSTIADMNGTVISALYQVPVASRYPEIMRNIQNQRQAAGAPVAGGDRFNPILPNGQMVQFKKDHEQYIALALYYAQSFWQQGYEISEDNFLRKGSLALFGLSGLMEVQNDDGVHPLAKLIGIGRSLIDSAVINFGFAFGAGVGALAVESEFHGLGGTLMGASGFLKQVGYIGLSLGFLLFYLLPFMPFIYFFFALSSWVKSIFEAMVGLPLWALAHMSIDGEGLPGPRAMNGYYLILEILLRPILTVVGLCGSIIIFTTQIEVLNDIWDIVERSVVETSDGVSAASEVLSGDEGEEISDVAELLELIGDEFDQLFYMVIYSVIAYMCALSSFKLIDTIPDQILRWAGASVKAFSEVSKDDPSQITSSSFTGINRLVSQMQGGSGALAGLINTNKS